MPTPVRAFIVCAAAALALPALASAADRYAVPSGGVASGSCPAVAPCTLRFALEGAFGNRPADGDNVYLAAGEYTEASPLTINYRLNISGPQGVYNGTTPWAFIIFPAFADGGAADNATKVHLASGSGGSRIERVAISGTATTALLVNAASAPHSIFDRVQLYVRGDWSIGLQGSGLAVSNTLVSQGATNSGGVAVAMTGSLVGSSIRSDNGTAISVANSDHLTPDCALDVRNTIATGGAHNAQVNRVGPVASLCTSVSMAISNSWIPASGTGGGLSVIGAPDATMTFGLGNLPATPAITGDSAFNGNWLFGPASPVINAGCTSGCGTTDMYGRPRPIGPANDIGAGESALAPIVSTPTASGTTTGSATVAATVNPAYSATTYRVQYRAAAASTWSETVAESAGSGTGDVAVSARLDGLSPGTSYLTRVVAINDIGTTNGAEASFNTDRSAVTPPTPAGPAQLAATWSRSRRSVRAIVTLFPAATGYRMTANPTKGSSAARKGRCVAARVKGVKRQRCTITLPKGTWTVALRAQKGSTLLAVSTRTFKIK